MPTLYEVIMQNKTTGERFLVGYTARKSGRGLRALIIGTAVGNRIAEFMNDTDIIDFGKANQITFLDWIIRFSGCTQKYPSEGLQPVPGVPENVSK